MVGIVNYGMGNLHSIQRKLHLLHTDFKIIENPEEVTTCERLILPGVGHFGMAMQRLEERNLLPALHTFVKDQEKPILGICLGMQLMTAFSEEGMSPGLGWIPTKIVRFKVSNPELIKVPHIGWNTVEANNNSRLLETNKDEFYFVHSFHAEPITENEIVLHFTKYEENFVSGFEKKNIFGVQYHPEKSHQQGLNLIKRFLTV
jgi:imidazole glycerol-phosphate synthase subunit HisH